LPLDRSARMDNDNDETSSKFILPTDSNKTTLEKLRTKIIIVKVKYFGFGERKTELCTSYLSKNAVCVHDVCELYP
jgi:hypothetical protein